MTKNDTQACLEIRKRLEKKTDLVELKVFGSRARGDFSVDSDLDLFVEVERIDKPIRQGIQDIAWEVGLEYSLVITPIIFSRHEAEQTPARSSPILQAIRQEGIPV